MLVKLSAGVSKLAPEVACLNSHTNNKWYRNLVVARTIADTLEAMNPQYPPAESGLENLVVPD